MLLCEEPVGRSHYVFAYEPVAAAHACLRRYAHKVHVPVSARNGLLAVVYDFAYLAPYGKLCAGKIGYACAVHLLQVVEYQHVAVRLVPAGQRAGKALNLGHLFAGCHEFFRMSPAPLEQVIGIDSAYSPRQRGAAGTGLLVGKVLVGNACPTVDVAVACSIDDYLGEYGLSAFLGLENDALYLIVFNDGSCSPAVVKDADLVLKLKEHHIKLYLKLRTVVVNGTHQMLGLCPAGGVHLMAPAEDEGLVLLAYVLHAGAPGGTRSVLFHAVEPLFLDAAHEGQSFPGEPGDHEHIVSCYVSSGVAVALHEDDVLDAGPRRSYCCAVTCRA